MPPPAPSPPRGGSQSGGNNGTSDPLRGDGAEIEDEADGGDRIGVKLVLREDESDVEGDILGVLQSPLHNLLWDIEKLRLLSPGLGERVHTLAPT